MLSLAMVLGLTAPMDTVRAEETSAARTAAAATDWGDLLQVSVNDGEKNLMSLYNNGLYEGKAVLSSGENTYRIFLNGTAIKEGTISSEDGEEIYIRYQSFQDKVTTWKDGADAFKSPATWVGNFSNLTKEDGSLYFAFNDWAPSDSNANLDYIGGGCYKKTFTFDGADSEKSMVYKIAFGGDWSHGAVPGSDKTLTIPEGSTSITLWANTITEDTFDSLTDGNETVKLSDGSDYIRPLGTMDMKIQVDGQESSMVQTGRNSYMGTVAVEAGEHSCRNVIDGQEGALSQNFTLTENAAVTFLYNSQNNTLLNSVSNADVLADELGWVEPVDADVYKYDGNDLGAVYSPESTTFKVWAPTASKVVLRRYAGGTGDQILEEIDMEQDTGADGAWSNGVWKTTVSGDLVNTCYTYLVTVGSSTKETNDIYAKAVGLNGQRGMVVNLADTNPDGWESDSHVMADQPTDAVVWEVHVRDFSSDPASGMTNRGKYLAFTEKGTTVNGAGTTATGIDYLKDLGVNYVQLLPVFDYVNDETDESSEGYNWGYSPLNYNVPEGLYSTDPSDGNVRIREFKQMVQSLHNENIGVVMDVVFNHVGGDAKESWFNRTVPGYYFRQDDWGNLVDSGTACGNETASEAEMFRKYMIDSVVYWATEYHIDGFRFDLMGCHDIETMNQLRAALDQIPGGEKILVYGEPWSAGTTNEAEGVTMVSQATMKQLDPRIGAFNDFIRDTLKGRVFDSRSTGFLQAGNYTEQPDTCPTYTDEDTMAALAGNTSPALPDNWAAAPSQVVSYISVHDNLGIYDKLQYSVNGVTEEGDARYYQRDENLIRMNKMAAAAIMTSPGITFFQAGEEMARSKGGVENSYNSPLYFDSKRVINQIDWARQTEYSDLKDYYKGLLKLRKAYAPFRASDMSTVNRMTFSDDTTGNLVAYTINSPGAEWDMTAVLMNSNTTAQEVTLKAENGTQLPESWSCLVNKDSAGTDTLETYQGNTITVPAQSVLVLVANASNQMNQPEVKPSEQPSTSQTENTNTSRKASQTIQYTRTYRKAYGSKAFTLNAKLTKGDGALSFKSSDKKVAAVSKKGKVTIKGTGRTTITVTAAATGNYEKKSVKITVDITPKKQSLSIKTAGNRKLTAKWKKDTRATGYQIQYSTDKKFRKNVKSVTVSKNKTTSKTISKLKKGKTYYVRVRAYKTINVNKKSKKLYGSFSSVKKSGKIK